MTWDAGNNHEDAFDLIERLNNAFAMIGSALRVAHDESMKVFPFAYARVELGKKFSQVYVPSDRNTCLPDFWRDGVFLAKGATPDIALLAQCIDFWMHNNVTTQQLADKFDFVIPVLGAELDDAEAMVKQRWAKLISRPHLEGLRPIVELATMDPVLSGLFPFTSHTALCFSRCTGYPHSGDLPYVYAMPKSDRFEVRGPDNALLGTGNAHEALQLVLDHLPGNTGPAILGTADDL